MALSFPAPIARPVLIEGTSSPAKNPVQKRCLVGRARVERRNGSRAGSEVRILAMTVLAFQQYCSSNGKEGSLIPILGRSTGELPRQVASGTIIWLEVTRNWSADRMKQN